ncbi:lactoylglutathione lyase [Novosphingobium sp. PC22D]|uniref:VOC family protein n=1 Tax=Novosphingobium sp. PC22D TaxID=1962403 RepID=UPI000BF12E29|nr:VOC family protein [Novosphingobium sp. PC22D]PEQ13276.1 lactoylglutathione lyase [Novosphingobium sp. PC22D]
MPRMIFVNLPVADLDRAMAFYAGMGFANNPQFTDETAACMVWSETIFVMILTHDKWRSFTERPIAPAGSSEVAICLTLDSREEVNALGNKAAQAGGTSDVNPAIDHGFMMTRSVADPDGHVIEFTWMDLAAFEGAGKAAA